MSDSPVPTANLEALNSRGVGVRIRFYWQGDRYGHQIDAVNGLISRTLLESVEGDQLANWPPSPPMQQVNVSWIASDSEQGHVAMLVGAAGKSHWSMCVSARDRRNDTRDGTVDAELLFDVACRTENKLAQFLGSTYRAQVEQVAASERLNCAFVPGDGPGLVVVAQDAELEVIAKRAFSPILRCVVAEIRPAESPATLRWRYAVRCSSGGPLRITANKKLRQH